MQKAQIRFGKFMVKAKVSWFANVYLFYGSKQLFYARVSALGGAEVCINKWGFGYCAINKMFYMYNTNITAL